MKIIILDGYTTNPGDLSFDKLKDFGDLTVYDRTSKEEVVKRVGEAEIVITSKTPIDKETLDACQSIKFIVVLAAGYDIVDIAYAKKIGIMVSNTPAYGSKGIAQMVFAHILEITNNVGLHSMSVKNGDWISSKDWCYWKSPIIDLNKKTIGIIGYGNIGREVGKIAKAFSMDVLAYDAFAEIKDAEKVGINEIFKRSDIITLNCPLTEETKHIIRKENIEKMKKGVIIINAARGLLVNEDDLKEAVDSRHVYACGADVVTKEPPDEMTEYMKCARINITPHIAWASLNSRENIIDIAYNNIKSYLAKEPLNIVNI